jgi:fructose/tagatose bisphosphate aldolase
MNEEIDMSAPEYQTIIDQLEGSVAVEHGKAVIKDRATLRKNAHKLAEISALEKGALQGWARYLTRLIALEVGLVPASIHDLYMARGRGDVPPTFTVPAMNLRALSFDAARAVFRTALSMNAGAFIFEIARSEIGYTDQRPSEYATSILAAGIVEGYEGPVFIQGDHFQISAKKYAADPDKEYSAVESLIKEAISAGFYNIDVDTSTLVDISKADLVEQQRLNTKLSASLTKYIRALEPAGVTISIGGEIGEVGGKNSTEEELRVYMDEYKKELSALGDYAGISKISIQTGTTHGGVVLPDGTIAQVSVDFDTLKRLSQVARKEYGLGGAVQHGASTLPEDAFGKFVENEACEVHLATNFQNMLFERLPEELRKEMYAYLDANYASERKEGMTDEQFYYKTRKNVIGPFKAQTWNLPASFKEEIGNAWQAQFTKLFRLLGVADTRKYVEQTVKAPKIQPNIKDYLGELVSEEDVRDLAD